MFEVTGHRAVNRVARRRLRPDPLSFYPPLFYCWTTAQFKSCGPHIFFKERAPGEKIYLSGEEVFTVGNKVSGRNQLVDVHHEAVWHDDPHGQAMASAVFQLKFADGSERPVSIRVLPTKYFLKGGLYGGLNGGFHGNDRGKLYFEHKVWELTQPDTRKLVRTLADPMIEVRDGDEVGYGIVEYSVGKGFAQYESVQGLRRSEAALPHAGWATPGAPAAQQVRPLGLAVIHCCRPTHSGAVKQHPGTPPSNVRLSAWTRRWLCQTRRQACRV